MNSFISFLVGISLTLIVQGLFFNSPDQGVEDSDDYISEDLIADATQCAPPQVIEKVVEKEVVVEVKASQADVAPEKENPKLTTLRKKMNIEVFDSEFRHLDTKLEDLVRRELAKDVPRGEIVQREFFENGDRMVQQETYDGAKVTRVYSPRGDLKEAHWKDPRTGKFQRRTYSRNKLIGVELEDGKASSVSLAYGPDGQVLEKTYLDPKSGDMIGTSFDDSGRPTSKWRDTKDGHMLTVWEEEGS